MCARCVLGGRDAGCTACVWGVFWGGRAAGCTVGVRGAFWGGRAAGCTVGVPGVFLGGAGGAVYGVSMVCAWCASLYGHLRASGVLCVLFCVLHALCIACRVAVSDGNNADDDETMALTLMMAMMMTMT